MGMIPPMNPNGQPDVLVDKMIGTAYERVKHVSQNIEYVKHVSHHLSNVYGVSQHLEAIETLKDNLVNIENLWDNMTTLTTVVENINDIINVSDNIPELDNKVTLILEKSAQINDQVIHIDQQVARVLEAVSIPAVKFAKIDTASSGSSGIVAAVSGKKIRVMSFNLIAGGTVNVSLRSGSTDLTGAYPLVAHAGLSANGGAYGVIETASGVGLNINLSAAVQVSGSVAYIEI